jgi:hypothetical protein
VNKGDRGVEPMSSVADLERRRTISGRELTITLMSEHLVNRVDRAFRATIAARLRDQAIQERIAVV